MVMDTRWHEKIRPSFGHMRGQEKESSKLWGNYALWVGNIPSQTTIMSLRDYFGQPAAQDLLSISYNPDARYAFVNLSTEASRIRAIEHAASQLFEGRRLDCRIRQGTTSRSTKVTYGLNQFGIRSIAMSSDNPYDPLQDAEQIAHYPEADRSQYGKAKYFIIKSGSAEALSQSLESGQWFVPNRHVKRLNHAFQTASKVYFIFSINGSRRFFGYASMRSEIQRSSVETLDLNLSQSTDNEIHRMPLVAVDARSSSEPMRVMKNKTHLGSRPRSRTHSLGSIYYEPERRRIIWEAPDQDLDPTVPVVSETAAEEQAYEFGGNFNCWTTGEAVSDLRSTVLPTTASLMPTGQVSSPRRPYSTYSPFGGETRSESLPIGSQARPECLPFVGEARSESVSQHTSRAIPFSSPCQVKWLSVQNISFDLVKGMKNRWNGNKDVSIARNVTAVDPGTGSTLVEFLDSFKDPSTTSWPTP